MATERKRKRRTAKRRGGYSAEMPPMPPRVRARVLDALAEGLRRERPGSVVEVVEPAAESDAASDLTATASDDDLHAGGDDDA